MERTSLSDEKTYLGLATLTSKLMELSKMSRDVTFFVSITVNAFN